LGIGGGEGVPESEMQPALKDYLTAKRKEGGYTPYTDVELQWLVDYVTGKKVSKKPSTITEIDIKMAKQAYENLKSGAVPRATTSTGTNLGGTVNPETGEISGGSLKPLKRWQLQLTLALQVESNRLRSMSLHYRKKFVIRGPQEQ